MGRKETYNHTEQTDKIIKAAYAAHTYGAKGAPALRKAAELLRWPRHVIYSRGLKLGVVPAVRKDREWTQAELDMLEKHAHKNPKTISRIMRQHGFNRSPCAVQTKYNRAFGALSDARFGNGVFSAEQVAAGLGLEGKSVTRWIESGKLKGKRGRESRHGSPLLYEIKAEDIKAFIIRFCETLNFAKVDKVWFVDILTDGKGERYEREY